MPSPAARRPGLATAHPPRFGDLLRRHRLTAGLSQDELTERAGLSDRGVSDLERGPRAWPRPETVPTLADTLGLDPTDRPAPISASHPTDWRPERLCRRRPDGARTSEHPFPRHDCSRRWRGVRIQRAEPNPTSGKPTASASNPPKARRPPPSPAPTAAPRL